MASLREEARWILPDAKDGILWLAIWKTGRTWHAETMYETEYDEGNAFLRRNPSWKIDEEDAKRLQEIYNEDNNAILVNPYYCNLGSWEEMTLESLMDGIRFQYELGGDIMDILQQAGRA